jgi:hypothetical protein
MGFSGHKTESTYRRYDIVVDEDLKSATQKLEQYQKRSPKPEGSSRDRSWFRSMSGADKISLTLGWVEGFELK